MLKQLLTKLKPMFRPMLNITLILVTLFIVYTCSCYMHNKSVKANVLPITEDEYTDPDLVSINTDKNAMKASIPEPTHELEQNLKSIMTTTPNDFRFNICGESKTQDIRIENENYFKPLSLMYRDDYRAEVSTPIIDNLNDLTFIKGFKECKS